MYMIKISEIEKLISQMNDDVQGNVTKIINKILIERIQ